MVDTQEFLATPMGKAVKELGENLQAMNFPPVKLNCIGGFALMLHDLRDRDTMTDIDYVGNSLGDEFDRMSDRIGQKHGLGKGWINNDGMLTGATMEDLEKSTGKLRFDPAFTTGNIQIDVLCPEDLLRMKLISIDTSLMAVQDGAADFSRSKDLPDIKILMDSQGVGLDDLKPMFGDMIQSDETIPVIKEYMDHGLNSAVKSVEEKQARASEDIAKAPEIQMDETERQAEKETDIGRMISSGGFSLSSILGMAQERAGRPMPKMPSRTGPGDDGLSL